MKIWLKLFMVCGLLMIPGLCLAAPDKVLPDTPQKITERHTPVTVETTGDDSIGARLSTRLKELFNSSNLFRLEEKDTPKFRILLSTMPEFSDRPGVGSAYSVVWVFSLSDGTLRHFLDRQLGLMTADQINETAAQIVEKTDRLAVQYAYLFPETQEQTE